MPETITRLTQWFSDHAATESLSWITITFLAYWLSRVLYRKSHAHPLLLPVVIGTVLVISVLLITDTPYPTYFKAVYPLALLIGPATVALAVPLFGQIAKLKTMWWPITVALIVGSLTALASVLLIVWAFDGSEQTLIALAPKAATMPIATSLVARFEGLIPLTAAAVAVTGITGAMLSSTVLHWALGPTDDAVHGFALGLSAHAIGTARALQISDTAGSFAVMAMSLNGLLTAGLFSVMISYYII